MVTIVELDSQKCEQVSAKVSHVIEGDATDPDILERTDLVAADVFAALTNDPDVNLAACEMAHETAPDTRTVLRISRDGQEDYGYRRFVDSIVYPAAAGAADAVDRITRE